MSVAAAVLAGSVAGTSLGQGATGQRPAVAFLVAWAALAGALSGALTGQRRHHSTGGSPRDAGAGGLLRGAVLLQDGAAEPAAR